MWERFVPFKLPSIAQLRPPPPPGTEPSTEQCGYCPHRLGWHIMVATGMTPMDGGVMLCPACPCAPTWAPAGVLRPERPAAHVLAHLRVMLFGIQ